MAEVPNLFDPTKKMVDPTLVVLQCVPGGARIDQKHLPCGARSTEPTPTDVLDTTANLVLGGTSYEAWAEGVLRVDVLLDRHTRWSDKPVREIWSWVYDLDLDALAWRLTSAETFLLRYLGKGGDWVYLKNGHVKATNDVARATVFRALHDVMQARDGSGFYWLSSLSDNVEPVRAYPYLRAEEGKALLRQQNLEQKTKFCLISSHTRPPTS